MYWEAHSQRIPRYVLLLTEIVKCTDPTHSDYSVSFLLSHTFPFSISLFCPFSHSSSSLSLSLSHTHIHTYACAYAWSYTYAYTYAYTHIRTYDFHTSFRTLSFFLPTDREAVSVLPSHHCGRICQPTPRLAHSHSNVTLTHNIHTQHTRHIWPLIPYMRTNALTHTHTYRIDTIGTLSQTHTHWHAYSPTHKGSRDILSIFSCVEVLLPFHEILSKKLDQAFASSPSVGLSLSLSLAQLLSFSHHFSLFPFLSQSGSSKSSGQIESDHSNRQWKQAICGSVTR